MVGKSWSDPINVLAYIHRGLAIIVSKNEIAGLFENIANFYFLGTIRYDTQINLGHERLAACGSC